jgi:hypothetical protein
MVIIGRLLFLPTSAREVGKIFTKQPPLSEYMTVRGPYIASAEGEGFQSTNIYEFDPSRMAEAFEALSNRYAAYHDVPGLTYSVRVCLEAPEALKMVGLD